MNFQQEIRPKPIQTIDEAFKQNFSFYAVFDVIDDFAAISFKRFGF
jgi:hypothetical protein